MLHSLFTIAHYLLSICTWIIIIQIILSWLTHELAGLPPWGNIPPESLRAANNDQIPEPQEPKAVAGRRRRRH